MNQTLRKVAQTILKELTQKLNEGQMNTFMRMYSPKDMTLPIEHVIADIADDQLDHAITQCENSIAKNELETPIYPEMATKLVTFKGPGGVTYMLRLWSKLRVLHEGKWYFLNFFRESSGDLEASLSEATSRFHRDVYLFLQIGQVNLNDVDKDNNPIYELCEDQTNEVDRLLDSLGEVIN